MKQLQMFKDKELEQNLIDLTEEATKIFKFDDTLIFNLGVFKDLLIIRYETITELKFKEITHSLEMGDISYKIISDVILDSIVLVKDNSSFKIQIAVLIIKALIEKVKVLEHDRLQPNK